MPFEKVRECANVLTQWIERQIEVFEAEETFHQKNPSGKSQRDMPVMSKKRLDGVLQKADIK